MDNIPFQLLSSIWRTFKHSLTRRKEGGGSAKTDSAWHFMFGSLLPSFPPSLQTSSNMFNILDDVPLGSQKSNTRLELLLLMLRKTRDKTRQRDRQKDPFYLYIFVSEIWDLRYMIFDGTPGQDWIWECELICESNHVITSDYYYYRFSAATIKM